MRSGTLLHRIAIEVETGTPDQMGGFVLTWKAVSGLSSVPAAIWPVSAKEQLANMALEMQVTHKVRIRHQPGITAKHRVNFRGRIFNIIAIINHEERNKTCDMLCTEVSK